MKLSPKSLIIGVIFVALILGYYYYLTNLNVKKVDDNDKLGKVDMVITENLDRNYPKTPRELIKFYTSIQKCYYNEEYEEEDLEKMADQARKLFDEELLAENPYDQFLKNLKTEVASYHTDGKTLNVTIPDTKDIVMWEDGTQKLAYVPCIYYVREGASYSTSFQTYVCRKDADGNWKILGWLSGGVPEEVREREAA
jgi:hypothetical protein